MYQGSMAMAWRNEFIRSRSFSHCTTYHPKGVCHWFPSTWMGKLQLGFSGWRKEAVLLVGMFSLMS